ncbi:MAG: HAD family hydrolase [Pseudomonadota bacterium]
MRKLRGRLMSAAQAILLLFATAQALVVGLVTSLFPRHVLPRAGDVLLGIIVLGTFHSGVPKAAAAETLALESWRDSSSLTAIKDFVVRVSDRDSPDYLSPDRRIAVFDNDGTLWAEQPAYFQLLFAADRARALLKQNPSLKQEPALSQFAEGGLGAVAAGGHSAIAGLLFATHAGMSTDEFASEVASWLTTSRHPTKKRAYNELTYQPMRELLKYLRDHGFQTWIVSGGGVAFMRVWVEEAYGIPAQQVIGSRVKLEYDTDSQQLIRGAELLHLNDGPGKPAGIDQVIGRRPILAVGNSDGDYEMLDYVTSGPGPTLGVFVHHTDAKREWQYDRESSIGKLDRGLDDAASKSWVLIDMQKDWKQVFSE